MKVQDLQTIKDVQKFFSYIVYDLGINFHIDTPFSDYVFNYNNRHCFTKKEALRLQIMMEKAIDICNANEVDEYEIAYDILQSFINS